MSNTSVIYPLAAALVKAEDILGPDRVWHASNATQSLFMEEFFDAASRKESSSIPEIESIAAWEAETINHFLRERGFNIQLTPFRNSPNSKEFGVASVLDLLVTWLEPGNEVPLRVNSTGTTTSHDDKEYPAVRMVKAISFSSTSQHPHAIARLQTQSDDVVYLTRLDKTLTGFDLLHYAKQLSASLSPNYDYAGVVFPMVDLKQNVDISWLIDMQTNTSDNKIALISQALQETHFSMDTKGAHAKSAVALGIRLTHAVVRPRPDLIIDGPMLVWCERPNLSQPLFVAHVTQEDWKKPEA
jgi:hypothetical protein